jgi:hypothetical protein
MLFVALSLLLAQEVGTPVKPVPSTITEYRVTAFWQERYPEWRFRITFQDSNGKVYTDEHFGLTSMPDPNGGPPINNPNGADTFLKAINTANFSPPNTSLMNRLLKHLETHGKIPPITVTGTPEK